MVDSGAGAVPKGISLTNTVHSEVAPCLPLPSLPVFSGARETELRLDAEAVAARGGRGAASRSDVAGKIASLLKDTDVSYLNLREEGSNQSHAYVEPPDLYEEVLRRDPEAFKCTTRGFSGPVKGQSHNSVVHEKKQHEQSLHFNNQAQKDYCEIEHQQHEVVSDDMVAPSSSRKKKSKKKASDNILPSLEPDVSSHQGNVVGGFCELLEDLCGRAEVPCDENEAEWLPLSFSDIEMLVNKIMSIRTNKGLHLVPLDLLVRLLKVLEHQIHRAEGLSINQCEHPDSDIASLICIALESIHAALGIMAYNSMPKQIYKEEFIERILEFSRHQIMDVMSACDPAYRAVNKPRENGVFADEDDVEDADFGSEAKRRRTSRSLKEKKFGMKKVSTVVNNVLQKLCTIVGFLKDLLSIERLSDSCIVQLVRTSFGTFMADNIHLLQLKSISLIGGIFYRYTQHRVYVIDEAFQLLLKLPFSRRIPRTYHLLDEEQRQIQIISALLIHMVHCSANLPDSIREAPTKFFDISIDDDYPQKSLEAITEACCLFWSRVLQRFTSTKSQDASELKMMMENVVIDLLTTLNLPEYPASAPILEVLCVLLLQNAGPASKDIGARAIAIDLLGTIAARLKRDAVFCRKEKFWLTEEWIGEDVDHCQSKDVCSVCLGGSLEKPLIVCQGCKKMFHVECLGTTEHETSGDSWLCPFCITRKQILVLQSYCKPLEKDEGAKSSNHSKSSKASDITKMEIVQQMLLDYLQDTGSSDDLHVFTRWFYLCMWHKDDPSCRDKFSYYVARLNSKAVVRGAGGISSLLTRNSVKKLTLALGQKNSFARGFDKIVQMLLVSLRENSPVIRAKSLRAVSMIVEADPEVLGDKHIQNAVEGRFCDSAISVREAALELVGRYIASHPDVALKYFDKVAERVKDTGVSVRKRAIKIIRDMCASNANFSEFNSACIVILSRVTDEESSIQDLVCKTFYELWFEEPSGSESHMFEDGSSVSLEISKKTEQIVEMLRIMQNHQLLVAVIKRNLALDFLTQSAKAAGINPLLLASVRKRCELMCKCLLEKILQVEEMNNNEAEVHALPYVLLLHAFCLVDPALCAPASDPSQFVVTLQPYLKSQADSRVIAQLMESIVFIIDSVLPYVRKLSPSVVEELEQDLKHMIIRHSFLNVVHACIKCLCSLSKVAGKGAAVVEYLVKVFFKRLDALGFDNKQLVGRSLFCLGLLIRYGNSLLSESWSSDRNASVTRSISLFKKYLQADDFVLKVRSLQALGYVLIAWPEYMLDTDVSNILEATLSSSTDTRLKIQALQNIYEFLLDAESKMVTDKAATAEATYPVDHGQSVPVAAGAGDTNNCGGIIQLYWNSILGRCLDVSEQVRQSALKIVEVVLRQGLVHPITCVPYLIALETDPQEVNSTLSHHLLMNMNEKYPSFFESRLGDGLQMSFVFIQAMTHSSENVNPKLQSKAPGSMKAGKSANSSIAHARLGVSRIYKLIRGNRVSRNKFMSSVIRKYDNPRWDDSIIPFLTYCTELLSLLPFASAEEPLYLIYTINRLMQVRAGALEANLKAFLHNLQGRDSKIIAGNGIMNQEPTALFQNETDLFNDSHLSLTDTRPVDLNVDSISPASTSFVSEDELLKIQADCLGAFALQLLLKLKRHLKIVYSLDDARCQAFSPNELPKSGEYLTRQNIPFDIGEISMDQPSTYQDILQRYQVFKNALRDDTVDYSIYTANIKRKRPPQRRGGKSGQTNGRDNEDDDDDDEDWGSAVRRPGSSRGSINTRSRQRL